MVAACRAETTFTIYKAPGNRAAPRTGKRPERLALDERGQLLGLRKLPQHRGDQG